MVYLSGLSSASDQTFTPISTNSLSTKIWFSLPLKAGIAFLPQLSPTGVMTQLEMMQCYRK